MKNKIFIFLCILTIIFSCKDENEVKFRLRNNSDLPVYIYFSRFYPDTSFQWIPNPKFNPEIFRIDANSIQGYHVSSPSNSYFDHNMDTLIVFVFDANILETTSLDSVKANNIILKRYILSEDDLDQMKWIVNYP